ncbi:unnamed protein product [Victoria cruziana]
MGRPHVLLLPFPAQGHVKPLMEFAHRLAEEGFMVTFVNTDFIHGRIVESLPENFSTEYNGRIRSVSIPDGVDCLEDRWNFESVSNGFLHTMPRFLEALILKINEEEKEKITFVIADGMIGTLLGVAEKLDIKRAVFWPASAWFLAIFRKIPSLLASGIIDENGFPKSDAPIKLSEASPALDPAHLCWMSLRKTGMNSALFRYFHKCVETIKDVDHIVCNSFNKLEWPFLEINSSAIPIGPLVSANHSKHQPSSFWREDWSCLGWLDQWPAGSVIYVSVGSITMLNRRQIDELALGLELTGRPFLWVCRPGVMEKEDALYPVGFMDRISCRGLVVGWGPQQEVLAHPSIACFLTHCGWNSTMEGLSNGVPMLCWPYIADQFQNQTYIVEVWKVGLSLTMDSDDLVSKEEIKGKLEALSNDLGIKERVLELKKQGEKSVMKGGDSDRRFHEFISLMKGEL